jgi:alkanesulfonate monooxygenase
MVAVGLAVENFTPDTTTPNFERVLEYAVTAERLGFDSVWVWDHLLLGSRSAFPFLESLTTLAAIAARTERVTLGTGVLVLPLRDPVLLAKVGSSLQELSNGRLSLGLAAGWYEREFQATGVPFRQRGQIFEQHLDLLQRLWMQDEVSGDFAGRTLTGIRMLPRPRIRPQILIGGYVERVLRRVATAADGWLTYFYTPDSFASSWRQILDFAEQGGRDPSTLTNVAELPLCIDSTYEVATKRAESFLADYFDCAPWSMSTPASAIRGTPEQCAEQIAEHLVKGVEHLVFVPCDYAADQVEQLAAEVLPLLDDISRRRLETES